MPAAAQQGGSFDLSDTDFNSGGSLLNGTAPTSAVRFRRGLGYGGCVLTVFDSTTTDDATLTLSHFPG